MTQAPQKISPAPALRAGAAAVDITPALGIQIAGDIGRPRPTEEVHDPIYAKALVLESGDRKLCILSLDLLAAQARWSDEIRRRAADRFGFDFDAVMVHTSQNHSAPMLGNLLCRDECTLVPPEHAWLRMGDDRYNDVALDGILRAIDQAHAALAPARIGAASGLDSRAAYNRRWVRRDGSVKSNPGRPEFKADMLHPEGPADPEVGVVSVMGEAGPLAVLLHHTCHPTHGYPKRFISADWPGAWCDAINDRLGAGCIPLVLNGCCGNILHRDYGNPTWVNDQERMGRQLAETAAECLTRVEYDDRPLLDAATKRLKIPLREVDPGELAAARDLLAKHPTPMWNEKAPGCVEWAWCYAVARVDLADRREADPFDDYEVQAFRLGSTAIVAVPGEPFVEGQLEIKKRSPVRYTYLAHMSNGCAGYIPTRDAFQGGGYETWTCGTSKLDPGALDQIVDATAELLGDMFAHSGAAS